MNTHPPRVRAKQEQEVKIDKGIAQHKVMGNTTLCEHTHKNLSFFPGFSLNFFQGLLEY